MPKRDSAPIGAPCWIDLFTSDPDKSRAFYGELFGWTSEEAGEDYGGYINFAKDGLPVAGCMRNDGESGTPDAWSVYLATEDAKATVDAAVANGGQVIVPAMEVMELGSMAVVTDVGGAAIGIWQPGLHKGFGLLAETGAPSWFELHTRDYKPTVQFYQDVFSWDTQVASDTDDFRYTTLGRRRRSARRRHGRRAFLPEGVPGALVGLLRRGRHRRRAGQGRRARRLGRAAR